MIISALIFMYMNVTALQPFNQKEKLPNQSHIQWMFKIDNDCIDLEEIIINLNKMIKEYNENKSENIDRSKQLSYQIKEQLKNINILLQEIFLPKTYEAFTYLKTSDKNTRNILKIKENRLAKLLEHLFSLWKNSVYIEIYEIYNDISQLKIYTNTSQDYKKKILWFVNNIALTFNNIISFAITKKTWEASNNYTNFVGAWFTHNDIDIDALESTNKKIIFIKKLLLQQDLFKWGLYTTSSICIGSYCALNPKEGIMYGIGAGIVLYSSKIKSMWQRFSSYVKQKLSLIPENYINNQKLMQ